MQTEFDKQQVANILACWQQTLTPEAFKGSEMLTPEDFFDAPTGMAQSLGLEKEFNEELDKMGFDDKKIQDIDL